MEGMPFRAIAVDMDGTFEDDNNGYDYDRFLKDFRQLKEKKIPFIVASGRPLSRLMNDFHGLESKIDFVADNGAVIMINNKIISTTCFSRESVLKIIEIVESNFPDALPVLLVSGIKHTYCLKKIPENKKKMMFYYYPNSIEINNFNNIPNDKYTKITISYPNCIGKKIEKKFNLISEQKAVFKTSGFDNIDFVRKGTNKAQGLLDILNYLKINPQETMVFGDSSNDL